MKQPMDSGTGQGVLLTQCPDCSTASAGQGRGNRSSAHIMFCLFVCLFPQKFEDIFKTSRILSLGE